MNLTQRELTSIIASAVQAALAAQQPKAAAPKAKPVARKRPAAKLQVVHVSAKAARNAATQTTRAERAESRRDWKAAIACPDGTCKPFADIRTVGRWEAEGLKLAAGAKPAQVAKSGAELYCRHSLAS